MNESELPGLAWRTTCRLCASSDLKLAVPLAPSAIADQFVPADRLEVPQPAYPMDLHLCGSCGHLQLLAVVDPEILFADYIYTSASSPGLSEHFELYADAMAEAVPLAGRLAVDVGSNDGMFLRALQARGARVVGVDPARAVAESATASGIPTLAAMFDSDVAATIERDHGGAVLVTANNVFAHADDLGAIADGVRLLLAPDGLFAFEVAYLGDMVEGFVFDGAYHEHLCHHSVAPLRRFLREHDLELIDVQRVKTKGGSIRCFAQPVGGSRPVAPSVDQYIRTEEQAGLQDLTTFVRFSGQLDALAAEVREALRSLQDDGRRVLGFGASASTTTLLHHFGIAGFLEAVVDERPARQGLFTPGYHLPVVGPERLYGDDPPDVVVILAWRFADAIVRQHARFTELGGRFLVPVPALRWFGPEAA